MQRGEILKARPAGVALGWLAGASALQAALAVVVVLAQAVVLQVARRVVLVVPVLAVAGVVPSTVAAGGGSGAVMGLALGETQNAGNVSELEAKSGPGA